MGAGGELGAHARGCRLSAAAQAASPFGLPARAVRLRPEGPAGRGRHRRGRLARAREEERAVAAGLARRAAEEGWSVVSGAARGIDETAMLAALEGGGRAIGIPAESLLRTATSKRFRRHVMSGALVLATPSPPETGFGVVGAMRRNRHICRLAGAQVGAWLRRGLAEKRISWRRKPDGYLLTGDDDAQDTLFAGNE